MSTTNAPSHASTRVLQRRQPQPPAPVANAPLAGVTTALQRTIGNHAIGALAGRNMLVQRKLMLGAVDTPAEREADAMAASLASSTKPGGAQPANTDSAGAQVRSIVDRSHALRAAARADMHAGAEGALDSGTEARIESARSGGAPLEPAMQREMEGRLGASLGGVHLHTGAEAHSLNQTLQARAFTTGRDIFFRNGEYRPGTSGGRQLLAHELTHVAQQDGGNGVQRKGIVQRAVGYEFEAGNWTLYKLAAPLTSRQKSGKDELPATQLQAFGIEKGAALHKGKGWALTADHSSDMHGEFVTDSPGFQEGKDGRKKLVTAMESMKEFGDKMIKSKSKAKIKVEGGALSLPLRTLSSKAPKDILMTPRSDLDAEPQTTAGIRLSQLAEMFDNFYKGRFTGEDENEAQERALGNQFLWGKQPRDQITVADSPDEIRAAWAQMVEKYKGVDIPGFDTWPALSAMAIGLASMLRSYLITADSGIAYAKSLAPLMARTDLGTMFNMLSDEETVFFTQAPGLFAELVLSSAGMEGTEDTPVISGKTQYIAPEHLTVLRTLKRGIWLKGITRGIDYLTVEKFPYEDVDQLLFGLGGLGDKMDDVGGDKDDHFNAPVFEFRRMQGRIQHYAWPMLAEEIFDWISSVNEGSGAHFTGAKTRDVQAGGGIKKKT